MTVDSIGYGVFFCTGVEAVSWNKFHISGMENPGYETGEEVEVPPERIFSDSASAAIYLTQWLFILSAPQLVFCDCGSNINIISGEVAES